MVEKKEIKEDVFVSFLVSIERYVIPFVWWYIQQCKRQNVPCDGVAYDLPDAYSDYLESLK